MARTKTLEVSSLHLLLKRGSDLLLGVPIFIGILPVLLFIALLIKIDSPGAIFFVQNRHGLNNKVFRVLKFRTMTQKASDSGHVDQVMGDDARVTRIGKLLRRTSLDELPQIMNVLKGDMSLVGPRPHAVIHNEYYRQRIKNYDLRHTMRPGITGLAQVEGFVGPTPTIQHMADRVAQDLVYIKNWSLWLDIKILLRTFGVIFAQNDK